MFNISFRVQIPPDETVVEPEIEEDDAELILEKVEEDILAECDDEDEDVVHVDDITKIYKETVSYLALVTNYVLSFYSIVLEKKIHQATYLFQSNTKKPDKILESTVDAEEWKLELERVLPELKLTIDAGDYIYVPI